MMEPVAEASGTEEHHLHVTVINALTNTILFAGEFASKQAFAEHVEAHFPERFQEVWFLQGDRPLSRSLDALHLPDPPLPPAVTLSMIRGPRKDLQLQVMTKDETGTMLLSGRALPFLHMSDIVEAIGHVLVNASKTVVVAQQAMTDEELTEQWQRTAPGQEPREARVMALWYVASDNTERGPLATSLRDIWEDALVAGHVRLRAHLEMVRRNFTDPVDPVDPAALPFPLLRYRNGRFDDFFRYA
jgi:hypothetical protein